jgi:hypothetical protein
MTGQTVFRKNLVSSNKDLAQVPPNNLLLEGIRQLFNYMALLPADPDPAVVPTLFMESHILIDTVGNVIPGSKNNPNCSVEVSATGLDDSAFDPVTAAADVTKLAAQLGLVITAFTPSTGALDVELGYAVDANYP